MLWRVVRTKRGIDPCLRRYASVDSSIRAKPWSFNRDPSNFQKTQTRTTTARYNIDLANAADRGSSALCFNLAAEMKQNGFPPNTATYNTLLRSLAEGAYSSATLAVLEDMLAVGVAPNTISLNHILDAHRTDSSTLIPYILTRMQELGAFPNAATYTLLITRFTAEENFEMSLQYLHDMKAHGLLPDVAAAQAVILLAANRGYPKLAVDLALSFESETVRKVEDSVWLACLQSSAAQLYAEGVSKSWYTLVKNLAVSPDEGLCTLVLHTAGRNGLPDLATDALRVLKVLDVPWMEHHLAPLFEAFCRAERYQDAFSTLTIMRQNNIEPTPQTALPILQIVTQRPQILDDLWEILSKMNEEGKTIDPSVCSTLLQASLSTQPLSRVLADYNMLKSLGVGPNAETFHIFLDGCISAGNVPYGELAFQQLKEADVPLDHDMFAKMITLHLTQDTYEGAFVHIEAMQSSGHIPAQHLYEALAIKCATVGDARYLIALDEMKEVGHRVTPEFSQRCSRLNANASLRNPEFGSLDGSAQKFIETARFSGNVHIVQPGKKDYQQPLPQVQSTFPEPLPAYLPRENKVPGATTPTTDPRSADHGRFSLSLKGIRRDLRRMPFSRALVEDVETELVGWLEAGGILLSPDSGSAQTNSAGTPIGTTGMIVEMSRTPLQLTWRMTDDSAFSRYVVHCTARYYQVVSFSKEVLGQRLTYLLRPNVNYPNYHAATGVDTPPPTDLDLSSQLDTDSELASEFDSRSEAGDSAVDSIIDHMSTIEEDADPALNSNPVDDDWSEIGGAESDGDESGYEAGLAQSIDSLMDPDATFVVERDLPSLPLRSRTLAHLPLNRSTSSPSRSPIRPPRRSLLQAPASQPPVAHKSFHEYVFS
ncbi:Methyltransf-25 domain-containing protein [Favolaschia claudopus]|uniref:Methyltransf-25 domain-containing protein n=1 Tax=Favolaschia claudopus TaxID=2862362 RepID=A0AAW0E040_9AGAR